MTIDEAINCYNIPLEILMEYESWDLCDTVKTVMGVWRYDDEDIERLGMIMTLHDLGFDKDEIADYMRFVLQGQETVAKRMRILKQKRDHTLDEIHFNEHRLCRIDYLRHELQKRDQTRR